MGADYSEIEKEKQDEQERIQERIQAQQRHEEVMRGLNSIMSLASQQAKVIAMNTIMKQSSSNVGIDRANKLDVMDRSHRLSDN